MRRRSLVVASLIVMFGLGQAMGQADNPPAQNPDPSNPFAMFNVQQMIDRASGQIVKRYTLTPEQEDFTRKLMTTQVNAFLDKHEQEIRQIFAEAIKYQVSGNPPPPEKVKEWTAQITPMFDEAKTQILDGNRQFREILSDDQKKIHDIDLRVMEQNFKDADKRLTRWREGGYDPSMDFGPAPKQPNTAPQTGTAQPPQPVPSEPTPIPPPPATPAPASAPATAAPSRVNGPTASSSNDRLIDLWEMYVSKFIDNYKLDSIQSNQALQILAGTKKQASEYLTSHKADYEKLQSQMAGAAGDQKSLAEINRQMAELNKPVQVDMFNTMKQRLDQIPTDAQRKALEESQPRRKATASGPAIQAPTSRPTGTRPATSRAALRRSGANRGGMPVRSATSRPVPQN
jgi:hypothetical protein